MHIIFLNYGLNYLWIIFKLFGNNNSLNEEIQGKIDKNLMQNFGGRARRSVYDIKKKSLKLKIESSDIFYCTWIC